MSTPGSEAIAPLNPQAWPALPLDAWQDTYATLHMWTQIIGKVRKTLTPRINHWWNVTLYVNSRGLTTSAIPHGAGVFEMRFDFLGRKLDIETSEGKSRFVPLAPRTVADFYREVMGALHSLGIDVKIHAVPDEVSAPIPFEEDRVHSAYDAGAALKFWHILVSTSRVLQSFRSRFIGKCSPVHFYWGSFDLAVTRFSGRLAPERPGADPITQEAYSHECISAGFWPGSGEVRGPAFYSYTAPEPPGLRDQTVQPAAASYNRGVSEFILMYDDVRLSGSPETALMDFLQSTYEAGANLANWDRKSLERHP
jgi:hypothetical protein